MDAPNLDLELARLITSGDRRRAAAMLVQRHASDVYALCRAMVRDATLAEDLSQDAFSRAIASLDSFRGEASVRTWILKIARNRCLDHLARSKRDPFTVDDDHDSDDHPSLERAPLELLTTREDAERALAAVSTTERALVVLHFGHGVGYPELSEAFGIKEGALRMRLSRALARMRDAVREGELRIAEAPDDEVADGFAESPPAALSRARMEQPAEGAPSKRGGLGSAISQLEKFIRPASRDKAKAPPSPIPPAARPAPAAAARAPVPSMPSRPGAAGASPSSGSRSTGAPAPMAPPPTKIGSAFVPTTETVVPTLHEDAPSSLLDRLAAIVRAL